MRLLLSLLAVCSLWLGGYCGSLGPGDCVQNVTIDSISSVALLSDVTCFQCDFTAEVPVGDFVYTVNNVPLNEEDGVIVSGVLVLFELTPPTETVRCSNTINSQVTQVSITVVVFNPPVITGSTIVNETDTLSLLCDASNSLPLPTLKWIDSQGTQLSVNGILMIRNINRTDTGTYICQASELFTGLILNQTVDVTVQYIPDVSADMEGLIEEPLGGTLTLSCSYQGVPPPTAQWALNGSVLLDSDADISVEFSESGTTLTRENLPANGGGDYTCTAINIVGSRGADTSVRVQLAPTSPLNLMVSDVTMNSLVISWTSPVFDGFSPIVEFRADINGTGVDEFSEPAGATDTQLPINNGLQPNTFYTIQLVAINEVELVSLPAEVTVTTVSLPLPNVTNLMAIPFTSTDIFLSWQEPIFNNITTSPVENYQLSYRVASGGQTTTEIVPPTVNSEGFVERTVSDLMKGTEYIFTVAGVNTVGPVNSVTLGPISTLIDPPTIPLGFMAQAINPFYVDVTWMEPEDNGGRLIANYTVFLEEVSGPLSRVEVVGAGTTNLRFLNLNEDTTYSVSILATNTAGFKSENATATVDTPPVGPPQVPDEPTVENITNQSIVVNWVDPGGFPFQYILQYKRRLASWDDSDTVTELIQGSTLSFTIEDLDSSAAYDVRIRSENINGLSNFSTEVSFTTFGEVTIEGPAQNETLPSGENIVLVCSIEGASSEDIVIYMWSKVGGDLPEGSVTDEGTLTIIDSRQEDSGVYVCTANAVVTARFTVAIEDPTPTPTKPERKDDEIRLPIIVGVPVAVGVIVIICLVVIVFAVLCLCRKKDTTDQPHKRTFSFRVRHWADSSGTHSTPRDQQKREMATSFHMPDEYTNFTSFNTAARNSNGARGSPSPPTHHRENEYAPPESFSGHNL